MVKKATGLPAVKSSQQALTHHRKDTPMAAMKTVPQLAQSHNLPIARHGVVTLFGYGIRVQVNGGHLLLHDGIADERRAIRLPRVNHGLKRLVIIGSDGFITLE